MEIRLEKRHSWKLSKAPNWGKGWDYSNQRKDANTFGPIDRIVIALGFLNSAEVHAPLLEKLDQLTLKSPLSHYKALCLALRMNKDDSLAVVWLIFLKAKTEGSIRKDSAITMSKKTKKMSMFVRV